MAFQQLVQQNVRLSKATERKLGLPTDKTLWAAFEREADERIRALPDGATVLDLGGGRRCVYAGSVVPRGRINLVAVDISADELALNDDVTETRVANVAAGLPLPDASADLILSRALLEHVDGVPDAARHMARVLKPGGVALHLVPGRYSLFGTAARVLPFGPLLRLLHAVMPWTRGEVEFPVVYDHCYPQGLERSFREAGFRQVDTEVTWAQPGYFEAIYPLFLLYAAYELATRKLRIRRLAAYTIVRATR